MLQNVDYDLIIVGGGIAGSALAVSLAQTGRSILILEKDGEFRDRIRGEVMMPWGSLEAKRLGIYDVLLRSCAIEARYYTRFRSGEPVLRDLYATTPENTCCMTFPHPAMQQALLHHAQNLGVETKCGVTVANLKPGNPPIVYTGSEPRGISARLVVLADGRPHALSCWLPSKAGPRTVDHCRDDP